MEALPDTEPRVLQIRAMVLGTAMDWIETNDASSHHILGFPCTAHGLQLGVEAALRSLGRVATRRRTATHWWTWPARSGRPARSDPQADPREFFPACLPVAYLPGVDDPRTCR